MRPGQIRITKPLKQLYAVYDKVSKNLALGKVFSDLVRSKNCVLLFFVLAVAAVVVVY